MFKAFRPLFHENILFWILTVPFKFESHIKEDNSPKLLPNFELFMIIDEAKLSNKYKNIFPI